jgi:RNA polymerase sigma-70 factor (ECF subfamily)
MSKGLPRSEHTFNNATIQQTAVGADLADVVASVDDLRLVEQLLQGDEAAFLLLINRYAGAMLRLAGVYVTTRAIAEEVVQETWMAVLVGLGGFKGQSSLKTWIFRILTNRAKTRAERERRSIPFSLLPGTDSDDAEPAVDPDRFYPADQQWPGHWTSFPSNWQELPEDRLLSQETRVCLDRAIEALAPNQREIIILRDVEGWTSEETCSFLGLSEVYQRVLLHRARSKVRRVLEQYFEER